MACSCRASVGAEGWEWAALADAITLLFGVPEPIVEAVLPRSNNPVRVVSRPRIVLPATLRGRCPPPLNPGCTQLTITPRWAVVCFKPAYHRMRRRYGHNLEAISNALVAEQAPMCRFGEDASGIEIEFLRRVKMAVAILLNQEGFVVRYPEAPHYPRPARADRIRQPWLRALLTGWT